MALEIGNSFHASCSVLGGAVPVFIGQSNFGFAPFGVGPNASVRLAAGRYRMRLLQPVNFVEGQGHVLPVIFNNGFGAVLFAIGISVFPAPGTGDTADILVQTRAAGVDTDLAFSLDVLRLPQQSTG